MSNPVGISKRNSLTDLIECGSGQFDNIFFHDAIDKSSVVVMFNGRNVHPDFERGQKIFNRWTWAEKIRHPTIILNDPFANNETGLRIAWYIGRKGVLTFDQIWDTANEIIKRAAPNARRVVFGSSGGGFAAIKSLIMGHATLAFAINPQTDIRISEEYGAKSVIEHYKGEHEFEASDLSVVSLLDALRERQHTGGELFYMQNMSDTRHYYRHMLPFMKGIAKYGDMSPKVSVVLHNDSKLKHGSPNLEDTAEIIGDKFKSLLVDET